MPTRIDMDRAALCYSLSLKTDPPTAGALQWFQGASARIQRFNEIRRGHWVVEKVEHTSIQIRNMLRPVGWCAARKYLVEAVADEEMWHYVVLRDVSTDAVEAEPNDIDERTAGEIATAARM